MTEQLAELFYNPKTGFISVNSLIKKAEQAGIDVSPTDIKKWYHDQDVNQVYHESKSSSSKLYFKVVVKEVGCLQVDLIDISKLSPQSWLQVDPQCD